MAKKALKVGHFYYHKMYTSDVYCVLRVFLEDNMKWVEVYHVQTEVVSVTLYDSLLGKTREVNERYWKSVQG